ncbi:unnamed protein product, partial [Vitis vinifera]|uniref:Uncharacterized protein n=1 Tax=Vitis vinifera TaxID=29760 RepID=D7TZ06_VITVI
MYIICIFFLNLSSFSNLKTLIQVTVPSLASVFNEYALKSQFETSIYLQNLFLYGYGAIFNFLGIIGTAILKGMHQILIQKQSNLRTLIEPEVFSCMRFMIGQNVVRRT